MKAIVAKTFMVAWRKGSIKSALIISLKIMISNLPEKGLKVLKIFINIYKIASFKAKCPPLEFSMIFLTLYHCRRQPNRTKSDRRPAIIQKKSCDKAMALFDNACNPYF